METIKTRRSIRKYQKRDVDNTLLSQLLEEAERTQTMGNLQLYSVVATRNSEIKEQLAPAHFNQPMALWCLPFAPTFDAPHCGPSNDKPTLATTTFCRS